MRSVLLQVELHIYVCFSTTANSTHKNQTARTCTSFNTYNFLYSSVLDNWHLLKPSPCAGYTGTRLPASLRDGAVAPSHNHFTKQNDMERLSVQEQPVETASQSDWSFLGGSNRDSWMQESITEDSRNKMDTLATQPAPTYPELDLPSAQDIPETVVPELLQMRKLFGAMLPPDIEYDPYTTGNPDIDNVDGMAFKCTYDEGYCGHFSVPGTDGAAANFSKVSTQEDMMSFIEKHLVFSTTSSRRGVGKGELVIHSGGLNTFHALKPESETEWQNETTTPQRLQHYIDTLGCPMAQLHMGTDMDQGAITIQASDELVEYIRSIQPQLQLAALTPNIEGNTVKFSQRQRDRLESLYSTYGYARPLWQDHLVALLRANQSSNRQLVLMPYSRSTSELASALRRYITEYIEAAAKPEVVAKQEVEAQLLRTLTVVTIGNTDRNWPDGPAYIHVSGKSEDFGPRGTDATVMIQGVHSGSPNGAGKGAAFLHSDWVFSGFDAHNFAAAGAVALRLTMAMNSITSWRQLWELLSSEDSGEGLRLPTYAEAAAGTVLVGGADWLWFAKAATAGVDLPSEPAAQALVGEWMGIPAPQGSPTAGASTVDAEAESEGTPVDTPAPQPAPPKKGRCVIC